MALRDIGSFVRAIIRQQAPPFGSGSFGVITDYNPVSRRADVRLVPYNLHYRRLPVATLSEGYNPPIKSGAQCWVEMDQGVPAAVTGIFHDPVHQAPSGTHHQGDMHVAGHLIVYGYPMTLGRVSALPNVSTAARGDLIIVGPLDSGATNAPDALYVCVQGTNGQNQWLKIGQGA